MSATQVLASARAGLESARGTGVTPTRIVYFEQNGGTHTQEVGTIAPEESWAKYTPVRRAFPGLERNTLHFSGDCTTEQMAFWLNLVVDAEASGSVTDTSAYTWTFLPVHTSDALKSATFQFAYTDLLATVGWSVPGCLGAGMKVTWTKPVNGIDTGVKYEVDLISASAATQITAFTGSLSDVSMTSFAGNANKTYVNGTGSSFGTTADTKINQATWEVTNAFVYRDGFDGLGNATELVRTGPRRSKLTVQRYFGDKTELDAYIAKTTRRLRVINEGAVVGAATAKNTLQLDTSGVWNVRSQAVVDGMIYANLELLPMDDSGISSDYKWTLINTLAAIT